MAHRPGDRHDSGGRTPLEHDRRIINGSILAIAAFVIVALGIAWHALTDGRSRTASVKPPAVEQSVPDGTIGYGGARPEAPDKPGAK